MMPRRRRKEGRKEGRKGRAARPVARVRCSNEPASAAAWWWGCCGLGLSLGRVRAGVPLVTPDASPRKYQPACHRLLPGLAEPNLGRLGS
eukprot:scaffold1504_cov417-Prasinococcus_capsulatus_cf.AAC.22